MTSNDYTTNLFKAVIEYMDNNNVKKSFDTAVFVPNDANNYTTLSIYGPFDNYTGTTSFLKAFTNLYDNSSEGTYNISGEFYGKFGTFTVNSVNDEQLNFKFNGASNPNGTGLMEISGIAEKIPDGDKEANYRFEYDGTSQSGAYSGITGNRDAKPTSHYRYTTTIDGKPYKIIIYFTSDENLTYLEWTNKTECTQDNCSMMNMSK